MISSKDAPDSVDAEPGHPIRFSTVYPGIDALGDERSCLIAAACVLEIDLPPSGTGSASASRPSPRQRARIRRDR